MKAPYSLSWARKSVYSALVFFGTLIVLSVGYAAWNATMSKITSWGLLTSAAWNALVDNIADLDSRWSRSGSNIAFTGGSVGIGVVSPGGKLDVKGGHFRVLDRGDGFAGMIMATDAGGRMDMYLSSSNLWGVGVGGSINQFNITSGGNVGIGTTSPGSLLQLNQGVGTNAGGIRLVNGSSITYLYGDAGGKVHFDNSGNMLLLNENGGNVGIGTAAPGYKLDVAGGVNASAGYTQVSDRRFKKDIQPIDSALSLVSRLQGVTFDFRKDEFKNKDFPSGKQVGFIAQEVEKVIPEVVTTDKQGYKGVEYANITAVLVEAVKEQQKQIRAQQDQVNALRAEVRALKSGR